MTNRAALLSRLARLIAPHAGERPLATRLGEACCELLGADGVSITVESATPNRVTLCATDWISLRLEELQDTVSQGPCWDAYLMGTPQTTVLDAVADRRWPEFAPAARAAVGVRTIYGLPMRPHEQVLGTLSIHRGGSGGLRDSMEAALFLADTVGAALLVDPQSLNEANEPGPWAGRAHIHQATGMVIAQLRIPAEDALAILRAHAFAENSTLTRVAQQVINRSLDFGKDPA